MKKLSISSLRRVSGGSTAGGLAGMAVTGAAIGLMAGPGGALLGAGVGMAAFGAASLIRFAIMAF